MRKFAKMLIEPKSSSACHSAESQKTEINTAYNWVGTEIKLLLEKSNPFLSAPRKIKIRSIKISYQSLILQPQFLAFEVGGN